MFRKPHWYALFAALIVAVAFGVVAPALSATTPVRVMPLGDSITAGPGCWRAMLWHQLQAGGYTNVDFVGGVSDGGGCNPGYAYDWDHEGHGGYSSTGIADNNQLPPWLAAARPDVVLMHLGTNDMWGGYIPTATKLTALTKLVGQMRANNASVKILVAQIIPMSQAACATCPADVVAFNNAIPSWAAGLTTAQSPIIVVDQWTGFDAVADTSDGVHPNNAGFQKMANRWYPALAQVLGGIVSPTAPATTTPPTTTTRPPTTTTRPPATTPPATTPPATTPPATTPPATTPPATSRPPTTTSRPPTSTGPGACSATYAKVGEWSGGFQGEVRVTNTGTTATSSWTVTLTFANGQRVTQLWNARTGSTTSPYTVTPESYNNAIAPGASITFGFLGSWTGTNSSPVLTCTRTP